MITAPKSRSTPATKSGIVSLAADSVTGIETIAITIPMKHETAKYNPKCASMA